MLIVDLNSLDLLSPSEQICYANIKYHQSSLSKPIKMETSKPQRRKHYSGEKRRDQKEEYLYREKQSIVHLHV